MRDFTLAIAAERDIEVIAQPCAEADVPATPEFLKCLGKIRLAEIDHEMKSENLSRAPGNIAVAAEVSVNLPGESIGSQ